MATVHTKKKRQSYTAAELLRLPPKQRDAILASAAARAEKLYRANSDLTGFDAYGEGNLHGHSSGSRHSPR